MRNAPLAASLVIAISLSANLAGAESFIVKDGKPEAQIVIAETTPRMVPFAAKDLQSHLKKMSGAELPIVTEPTDEFPVKIYVGESEFTKKLGVTDEGLKYGAFRMKSGPDHLILLGRDFDFDPKQPGAMKRGDGKRAQKEWEEVSGGKWINPRSYHKGKHQRLGIWKADEGGSLNAVCGFLRTLGVRWYMPGDLGAVVPEKKTIPLPKNLDETVRPDYPARVWLGSNFLHADWDALIWERRVGINSSYEALGASGMTHGLTRVHGHDEMKATHPEYYALVRGKRDVTTRGSGHACFSSPGLERETVNFLRAVFNHFDEPIKQLSPQDGMRKCGCPLCAGKSPSEQVWGFLDRVAREVYKTHPDRKILGAAYTYYRKPPESIDELSPNLALSINNVGRCRFQDPKHWKWYTDMVNEWAKKTAPGNILRVENNLYSQGGRELIFPVIHPRSFAKDLKAMKGISMGERNEVPRGKKQVFEAPGANHLNLYVNARYLWDADRDVEAFLDEYYEKFYGPAAEEMKAAFDFAEANSHFGKSRSQISHDTRLKYLELLHQARKAAGDTAYGNRIQVALDEMQPIEQVREERELAAQRGKVPGYGRMVDFNKGKWKKAKASLKIDGELDESFWTAYGGSARLRESRTGRDPAFSSRFTLRWCDKAIVIGVRCEEPEGEKPYSATTKNDDPTIFEGDFVSILLETDQRSFYEIAVNPAGAVYDIDHQDGAVRWASQAEVATRVGDGYWSAELRIPIVPDDSDPLHRMIGKKPTKSYPWHFNVCRQRVRESGDGHHAFSPTGESDHRDKLAFGALSVLNTK